MAPTRRPKSVNKKVAYTNEAASKKKAENADRSGQRKRKLSDMLGPEWSKEELERFYEAYRKYGKDWKKVAAAVRNRSPEMVEAIFTMNRAYLSLPEGTASAVGLIAMMTDHYGILAGSDSEQESVEATGSSQNPQKRVSGKFRNQPPKGSDGPFPDLLNFQSGAPNNGCLSLLKKRRSGSRPRAVAKRTPRVPVSYSNDRDNTEKYLSPIKQGLRPRLGSVDDDVAHEIALALTEASQRGGSPLVSQTPKRKRGTPSPLQKGSRTHGKSEMTSSKLRGSEMDEDGYELSLGSTDADYGYYSQDKNVLMEAGTVEIRQKRKKDRSKKQKVEESEKNRLHDIKEACSGTEEGQDTVVKGKFGLEIADEKSPRSSLKISRKQSKKVLFTRDEGSEFDALQTLADLSLMMPETTVDTELSLQLKEEKPGAIDESELKGHCSGPGVRDTSMNKKSGKDYTDDVSVIPELDEENHHINAGSRTKRQKFLPIKLRMDATDESKKFASKGKRSLGASQSKQGKLTKPHELSTEHEKEDNNSGSPRGHLQSANQVNLPAKVRSRRKTNARKLLIEKDKRSSEDFLKPSGDILDDQKRTTYLELKQKEQLSNCLSWYQVRRWCIFEWFYSAIDYPWFAKREFVEYLDHVGLSHVPRLTHVEWGVIRSSLGRPRRFSEQFLKEEKEKLNQYRESVRTHYSEVRAGKREGLPTDLARPLFVGQRIIAVHPRTREIHDGSVLTVDHSRYRVQFDQCELGVEFVRDIDCMPFNPSENMPASLMRQNVAVGKFIDSVTELKMNGQTREREMEGYMKFTPCENMETINASPHISPSTSYPINNSVKPQKGISCSSNSQVQMEPSGTVNTEQAASQPSISAQIHAREADVQALSDLTCVLEKKEAVVSELRRLNDEVLENKKVGDNSLKDSELFKKHYAAVLLQLNEVNEQVASALFCLRQRNTYQGSPTLTGSKPVAGLDNLGGLPSSFDHSFFQASECGPHVTEVVELSRSKAQKMVDVALQALSSLEKEGNGINRVEEAMDFVNNKLSGDASGTPSNRSSTTAEFVHSCSSPQDQHLDTRTSNPLANTREPDSIMNNLSDKNLARIPSELIAHCVATLLMIQRCTERDFPPADVAQVLDSAVTSLQPCCPQNLPVYAEIQKCMGIIKNQILALIPTST